MGSFQNMTENEKFNRMRSMEEKNKTSFSLKSSGIFNKINFRSLSPLMKKMNVFKAVKGASKSQIFERLQQEGHLSPGG